MLLYGQVGKFFTEVKDEFHNAIHKILVLFQCHGVLSRLMSSVIKMFVTFMERKIFSSKC